MLTAGLKHELTITVEDKLTAAAVGSGALPVFSTPSMPPRWG
jgi:predicted thioesterase